MAKFKVTKLENKKIWEEFVLSRKPRSFLQSWNWGETNKLLGYEVERVGFYRGKKLKGVCQMIFQNAKRGRHFLIPGGPILDWNDKNLVNLFLSTIKRLAREKGAWFIRVRPEILDSRNAKLLFRKLGFVPSPMHLHAENTWVLDIGKSEEELLMGMRKTTRYLVRKSLHIGLDFEETVDPSRALILKKLQDETVKRHKFVGFPFRIFKAQLETFGKDNQARLFLVRKNRKILAAAIIIFYHDTAYYHHSASSSSAVDVPASYFLQWKVIEEAKKRGLKYYNFWGIAPNDNPRHRFAGVTLFKKGFGGERIDWLHAHDLPISPFYVLTYIFERIRRIVRRL